MEEFNSEKSSCLKEQALIIDKDRSLKATDEFDHISAGQNAVTVGSTPYFLKIPKIGGGIIYVSEGVFPKVLPPLAQLSIQSRLRGGSHWGRWHPAFDLRGVGDC